MRNPRIRIAGLAICLLVLLTACEEMMVRDPGEKLWRKHCAGCHGLDASGNTPRYMGELYADLRDNNWRGSSDRYAMTAVIRQGVFGKMPANEKLSDAEVEQVLGYLFALRGESLQ